MPNSAPPNSPAALHWDGHRKGPVGFLSTTILDPIALCKWAKLWGFLALHSIMLQRRSASQSLTAANSTQWNSTYPQWLTDTVTRSVQAAVLEQWAVRSIRQPDFFTPGIFMRLGRSDHMWAAASAVVNELKTHTHSIYPCSVFCFFPLAAQPLLSGIKT